MDLIIGESLDEEHDLNFEVTRAGPSKVNQLVVNGAIDIGHAAPTQAAAANRQGNNMQLFGPWLANHTSLVVKSDSSYESWEDLRGETVATLPEPTASYYDTTLRLSHMDIEFEEAYDVEQAGTQTIHSYFQRGDVDAYVIFPPLLIPTLADGDGREIERLAEPFREIYGGNLHFQNLAASNDWLEENEERASAVVDIFVEASEMMAEDPVSYLESNYTDTANYETDEHYELAAERTSDIYPGTWEEEDRQQVQDQIEELKDLGHLEGDTPSDVTVTV
ncbi:ABC transporter substrate-binding protein [Natrinema soli]|uniref:ABC transporter substrate-binding protein n=1 Tax=Natrinema soli TaxID=1930624 RepID=A0ABD5SLB7_9EURY|nr:ABC transporter substrate-binding protein [Natrinema soli]